MFGKASKKAQRKLEESGVPGYGVLLGMRDTHVSFGGEGLSQTFVVELTLEVHANGLEPYQATVKHRVRMLELGQLQVGAKIGVVVDPDDPQTVAVATPDMAAKFQQAGMQTMGGQPSPAAVPPSPAPVPTPQPQPFQPMPAQPAVPAAGGGGGLFGSLRDMSKMAQGMMGQMTAQGGIGGMLQQAQGISQQAQGQDPETQRILATGVQGVATILAVRDTGMSIGGDDPLYYIADLDLQIDVEGRAPYQATVRHAIQRLQIAQMVPGVRLAVKVDPADPARVALMTG